jgi:hypothetical protein
MGKLISFTRVLCAFLGILEFCSTLLLLFDAETKLGSQRIVPSIVGTNFAVKVVFGTYLSTLGIQRLSWALGNGGFWPWLCLIASHVIESVMWWTFALLPEFRRDMSIVDLCIDVVCVRSIGGVHAVIVLYLVPVLIGIFILTGPGNFIKHNEKLH